VAEAVGHAVKVADKACDPHPKMVGAQPAFAHRALQVVVAQRPPPRRNRQLRVIPASGLPSGSPLVLRLRTRAVMSLVLE